MFKKQYLYLYKNYIGFFIISMAASNAFATTTTGTLSNNSPIFNVASAPLGGVSGCGIQTGNHRYETQTFTAPSTAARIIDTTSGNYDNFIALYSGVFNPQAPTSNLIACDDDSHGSNFWSKISNANLVSGQSYTIVFTSYVTGTNSGTASYSILPDVTLGQTVGGSLTGLGAGKTVILQNNGGTDLSLNSNGNFVFNSILVSTNPYNTTVLTQPTGQTCSVSNGSGTITNANINNIIVTCTDVSAYNIGGSVTGLGTGKTVILKNNAGDDLTVNANGNFTFATAITTGNTYAVTVGSQPSGQTCSVTSGSGTANANVTNVSVSCSNNVVVSAPQNIPTLGEWAQMMLMLTLSLIVLCFQKRIL